MKIKLLTALLFVLPVPAAFYICVCHPTFAVATAIVLSTGYVFVRILRILRIVDPSDIQVKSKPTQTTATESGDHIWPPQPVDDVDHRRKDSRPFRLRSLRTA